MFDYAVVLLVCLLVFAFVMIFSVKRKKTKEVGECCICGVHSVHKDYRTPKFEFHHLEDSPWICQKCMFAGFTGKHAEWCNFTRDHLS